MLASCGVGAESADLAAAHEECTRMRRCLVPVGAFGPWQVEYILATATFPLS